MSERTIEELKQLQSLPLWLKVRLTKDRIRQWINAYGEDGVYVSFSGGKDSTVLLHLVREDFERTPACFIDTGLEYPEIRTFIKGFENVEWIKPKMTFKKVIEKYGYPFISKEVSESVYGARKYLTELQKKNKTLTDRQTDRQTDLPYYYWYERVTGTGRYKKVGRTGGNNERKDGEKTRGKQPTACNHVGNADKGQSSSDKGKCP